MATRQVLGKVNKTKARPSSSRTVASKAAVVQAGLGDRVEVHQVKGATHFSFLAPCGPLGPARFCNDAPDFDRRAVHRGMNAEIIRFLAQR